MSFVDSLVLSGGCVGFSRGPRVFFSSNFSCSGFDSVGAIKEGEESGWGKQRTSRFCPL